MAAIDEVQGLDRETFNRLYEKTNGFRGIAYPPDEGEGSYSFGEILREGAEIMIKENSELVTFIKDAFAGV